MKRPILLGLTLLSVLLWIFILILWENLSLQYLLLSPVLLKKFSSFAYFILNLPLFLKILFVFLIIFLQIMLYSSKHTKYSEKILLCLFHLGLGIVTLLWGYYFLIQPLLSYNQTIRVSLGQH